MKRIRFLFIITCIHGFVQTLSQRNSEFVFLSFFSRKKISNDFCRSNEKFPAKLKMADFTYLNSFPPPFKDAPKRFGKEIVENFKISNLLGANQESRRRRQLKDFSFSHYSVLKFISCFIPKRRVKLGFVSSEFSRERVLQIVCSPYRFFAKLAEIDFKQFFPKYNPGWLLKMVGCLAKILYPDWRRFVCWVT